MNRQLLEKEVLDDTGKKLETEERYAAIACMDETRLPDLKRQLMDEIEDLEMELSILEGADGDHEAIICREHLIQRTIDDLRRCIRRIEHMENETLSVNELTEFARACFFRAASESFISATQKLNDAELDDPVMVLMEALNQTGDASWGYQIAAVLRDYAESFHPSLAAILPDIEYVRSECQKILLYTRQEVEKTLKNY